MKFILTILTILLWAWALWDLAGQKSIPFNRKVIWLLIILFFPVIGSIVYFLFTKRASGRKLQLRGKK